MSTTQAPLQLAEHVYILRRGEIAFAGESAELDDGDVFRLYLGGEALEGTNAG